MEPESKTKHRKKVKHYNIPGHAHELTFSCYHRYQYLVTPEICLIFLEELGRARNEFQFELWAYVLMPNHAHLLIYPKRNPYKISAILQSIKGRAARRYGDFLQQSEAALYDRYCIGVRGEKKFVFGKPEVALTEISGTHRQYMLHSPTLKTIPSVLDL